MAFRKIDGADTTDVSSEAYSGSAAADRGATQDSYHVEQVDSTSELTYINQDYMNYYSQYRKISQVGSMIDRKALLVAGSGWESPQKEQIEKINGNGKDTFDSIMVNMTKVYTIGGDSYAEIVMKRSFKSAKSLMVGDIVNLKPIAAQTVKTIANKFGIIKRYEIYPDGDFTKKATTILKPHKMFHLMWNRTGDEIHGQSTLEKMQCNINSVEEGKKDSKILFHRYVKPLTMISVDTDDATEISTFKATWETAYQKSEVMVIPAETVKDIKTVSVPQYSTLDPLPWIRKQEEDFTKGEGIADVVLGVASKEMTEASGKILYLSVEAVIKANQMFLTKQLKAQLDWDVTFQKLASLEPELKAEGKREESLNNQTPGSRQ